MGYLLRLITAMLLTIGALSWLIFLGQLYEKLVHPGDKNLSGGEFFLAGLVLVFFTLVVYIGFRPHRETPPTKEPPSYH